MELSLTIESKGLRCMSLLTGKLELENMPNDIFKVKVLLNLRLTCWGGDIKGLLLIQRIFFSQLLYSRVGSKTRKAGMRVERSWSSVKQLRYIALKVQNICSGAFIFSQKCLVLGSRNGETKQNKWWQNPIISGERWSRWEIQSARPVRTTWGREAVRD